MSNRQSPRSTLISLIILTAILVYYLWDMYQNKRAIAQFELDRSATITYSKHAKCRMNCRHISEDEVEEVLEEGKINPKKSDFDHGKFAMEDRTDENQNVRVIFAINGQHRLHVVTTIDLDRHWQCDCR